MAYEHVNKSSIEASVIVVVLQVVVGVNEVATDEEHGDEGNGAVGDEHVASGFTLSPLHLLLREDKVNRRAVLTDIRIRC